MSVPYQRFTESLPLNSSGKSNEITMHVSQMHCFENTWMITCVRTQLRAFRALDPVQKIQIHIFD